MFPLFICCTSGHCSSKSSLQFMLISVFTSWNLKKQNNIFCTSEVSLCFTQKNNFCLLSKIKLVWFYSLNRFFFFLSKIAIFSLHFKNIFYHVTLENIFRMLNNSVYFQNIVVCNELLTSSYIFVLKSGYF